MNTGIDYEGPIGDRAHYVDGKAMVQDHISADRLKGGPLRLRQDTANCTTTTYKRYVCGNSVRIIIQSTPPKKLLARENSNVKVPVPNRTRRALTTRAADWFGLVSIPF